MRSAAWKAAKDREIAADKAKSAAAAKAVQALSNKDRKKARALAKKNLARKGQRLLSSALSGRDILAGHQQAAAGKPAKPKKRKKKQKGKRRK